MMKKPDNSKPSVTSVAANDSEGSAQLTLTLPLRRVIASVGIVVFLCLYVMLVSDIGRHLPRNDVLQLLFYALAGVLWGVPVLPLISWSEAYKKKPPTRA